MVQAVSNSDFQAEVLDAPVPVLVDFFATWCGPCRLQHPVLAELEGESAGLFKVVKVDTDSEPGLATRYGVTALPTLMLFRGGQAVERWVGLQNGITLRRALSAEATR